jgi:ribosomal protein L16 Arg81 hydroxylase
MSDYSTEQRLFYLDSLLSEEECLSNYKNAEPFKFNKKVSFNVSWDELFILVNNDIKNNVNTNQSYYNGKGFKIRKADRDEKISMVVDSIEKIFQRSKNAKKERPSDMHQIYINFTTDASTNDNIHSDNDNVFFWQLQGSSTWKIYKDSDKDIQDLTDEDISHTFDLNVGDIIFCPKNRRHSVITRQPRAGVSLGFYNLK